MELDSQSESLGQKNGLGFAELSCSNVSLFLVVNLGWFFHSSRFYPSRTKRLIWISVRLSERGDYLEGGAATLEFTKEVAKRIVAGLLLFVIF